MSQDTSRRVFVLRIDTENDAFGSGGVENPFGDSTNEEVARILHTLAERMEGMGTAAVERDSDDPFLLKDGNGASVGTAYFTYEEV